MRENIRNYWKVFGRLCQVSEKYSAQLASSGGEYSSRAYLSASSKLIEQLSSLGKLLGLPILDKRERTLTLNCLFDAEIRRAYIEEAKKLESEAITMADLRRVAMERLAEERNSKRTQKRKRSK